MESSIILFVFILFFSSGVLGIVAAAIWRVKYPVPYTKALLLVSVVWTCAILLLTFHFFFYSFLSPLNFSKGQEFLIAIFMLSGFTVGTYIRLIHAFVGLNRWFLEIIVTIVMSCIPWFIRASPDFPVRNALTTCSAAVMAVCIVPFGVYGVILLLNHNVSDPRDRKFRLGLLIFTFAIVGTAVIDSVFESLPSMHPVTADHVTFLFWNCFVAIHVFTRLQARAFPAPPDSWRATYKFTPREQQTAEGITNGWSNKKIAQELGIEESTVKTYVSSIFQKCGVPSRFELISLLRK